MKVGIIQSGYFPWRGYFDFIASVDLFVLHDDLQYTAQDWRNRNRIKTRRGLAWITVPVRHCSPAQRICETAIDYSAPWFKRHLHLFLENYRSAPFLEDALALLELTRGGHETINALNAALISAVCRYLGISTPIRMSDQFEPRGTKTERVIDILCKAGATSYLTGPRGLDYLDLELFRCNRIALAQKSYDYAEYSQLWGGFESGVTILDLIANCGPAARDHICSRSPDDLIVPGTAEGTEA